MSHKNFNQRDLADCMLTDHKALHELDDVYELIDWQNIEKRLDSVHNNKCGNSAYPPLMMFKALASASVVRFVRFHAGKIFSSRFIVS